MRYRHAFHAGNFADVHKHVVLLALLAALKRKDKGFAYLETHAGRGAYELAAEAETGVERLMKAELSSPELRHYAAIIESWRRSRGSARAYPGSPLLAAQELRAQDRAVFIEVLAEEARALQEALGSTSAHRVERGDGFERLRAWLPPPERRGLTFIDPPYEETRRDFQRVGVALQEVQRRFPTGITAVWFPVKDERHTTAWLRDLERHIKADTLISEFWLYPRDSTVALNGSGMLVMNPPHQLAERMQVWLPELHAHLDPQKRGGWSVRRLHQDFGDVQRRF